MLLKTVIFVTFAVFCVSSECQKGCRQFRSYTRVKRGKFYPSPPLRFYNRPPMTIPIKGPFSYTPPPFMTNDEPSYPGSKPYKVSKRPPSPSNDGLGDDDINNLVKHLTKQDLDKLLEFAQEKDQGYNKYKDTFNTNEHSRPYKTDSKTNYRGSHDTKEIEELPPYTEETQLTNYVTEPNSDRYFPTQELSRPVRMNLGNSQNHREPYEIESLPPNQSYINSAMPVSFPNSNNYENFVEQEPLRPQTKFNSEQPRIPNYVKSYSSSQDQVNFKRPQNYPDSIDFESDATFTKDFVAQDSPKVQSHFNTFNQRMPHDVQNYPSSQDQLSFNGPKNYPVSTNYESKPTYTKTFATQESNTIQNTQHFPVSNNFESEPTYTKDYNLQESPKTQNQLNTFNQGPNDIKSYSFSPKDVNGPENYPVSNNYEPEPTYPNNFAAQKFPSAQTQQNTFNEKIPNEVNTYPSSPDGGNFKTPENFPVLNYESEATYTKDLTSQESPKTRSQFNTFNQRIPNDVKSYPSNQDQMNFNRPDNYPVSNNYKSKPTYPKDFAVQESPKTQTPYNGFNQKIPNEVKTYTSSSDDVNSKVPVNYAPSKNPFFTETNEEEKLPPPVNMKEEDYEVSYSKKVPSVVKAQSQSNSYDVENFGDLPLMDYNSMLYDVSSYHVPQYTVTQPKPVVTPSISYSLPSTIISGLLRPSPAAASIKEPPYERAPPTSAAADQGDAHLKVVKIWSHKSKGAAYTLNDDGTLTPERYIPKYG